MDDEWWFTDVRYFLTVTLLCDPFAAFDDCLAVWQALAV